MVRFDAFVTNRVRIRLRSSRTLPEPLNIRAARVITVEGDVKMGRVKGFVLLASVAVGLSACGVAPLPVREEFAPVPSGPISFDDVVLSEDGRTLRVEFIGGRVFDHADPCSMAYEATAQIVGEELEIGIYARRHPMPLPPNTGCDAMGHLRTVSIELEQAFTGTTVRDLAGGTVRHDPAD
jgi:hypothetical protein